MLTRSRFISENPVVAKLQYWMKIIFVFILILFIDSVNRVYRVQVELASAHENANGYVPFVPLPPSSYPSIAQPGANDYKSGPAGVMGHERQEVQIRKFYSQRNMYLCGFTLFLSLILNRTYVMIIDIMQLEDRVRAVEVTSSSKHKGQAKETAPGSEKGEGEAEVQKLRAQLEEKTRELEGVERDFETMKKQAEGLGKEYDALCDKYGETQKVEAKKIR